MQSWARMFSAILVIFTHPARLRAAPPAASRGARLLDSSTTVRSDTCEPVKRARQLDEKSVNVEATGDDCTRSPRRCVLMPRINPSDPITCFVCKMRNVKCRRTVTVPKGLRPPTTAGASSLSQVASSSVPSVTEVEDRPLPNNHNRSCDKTEDHILAAYWGAVCASAKVQIQAAEARRDCAQREYIRTLGCLIQYCTSAGTVSHSNSIKEKGKGK
ncbi:hypothetical protein EDB83DRAFT_2366730 [Lactarius deliciosus]|nr:hypothetical protein EDB83DRAFT_2366730 [Lactarius deliciosus]